MRLLRRADLTGLLELMEGEMQIAKWLPQPNGGFAWVLGSRFLGEVYAQNGRWRVSFLGTYLSDDFPTAHDACLAAEKRYPQTWHHYSGWLESKNGGYFRKFGNKRTVYVRKAENGWYAVQTDGKLLGKGKTITWFTAAEEACAAVEKELHTPVVADPFVGTSDQWRWVRLKDMDRAA